MGEVKSVRRDASKGLTVEVRSDDPSSPEEGRIWYNSAEGKLKIRVGGKNHIIARETDVDRTVDEKIESIFPIDWERIAEPKPPVDATRNVVYRSSTKPRTGMKEGDFWLDTSKWPYVLYQYDGTAWQKSIYSDLVEMHGQLVTEQLAPGTVIPEKLLVPDWYPEGLEWYNNTPSEGYVKWSSFKLTFNGEVYNIEEGYTDKCYIYWVYKDSKLSSSNEMPTLGKGDCLVAINDEGTVFQVLQATALHGGSVLTETITETKISDNAISTPKLKANAVTAEKIVAEAITSEKIATGAVVADKIGANQIKASHIDSGQIHTEHLAAECVTSDKIKTGTILAKNIASGAITAEKLYLSDWLPMGLSFTNDPTTGTISWDPFSIVFMGTKYDIPGGSTTKKYLWWDYSSPNSYQTSDTKPTLQEGDTLIAINDGGTAIQMIPQQTLIHGGTIRSGTITADEIKAGEITAEKLAIAELVIDGLEFTDNPTEGSISWTDCKVYFKGTRYDISGGSTTNKYVYWDKGNSFFSTSSTKPEWAEGRFLIAVNESGYHREIWNATLIHGGSIVTGSITAEEIKVGSISADRLTFRAFDKDVDTLDSVKDGTSYGKVKKATLTADGLVLLSGCSGTLDDIANGSTYGKVKKASLTADGLVLLDQTVDGTYGKVLATDISAGHIKLSATIQDSSHRTVSDSEKTTWNNKPDNMDEIAMGVNWRKVSADQCTTSGYLKITSNTLFEGEWYNKSGVLIDAESGIQIYGTDMAFTTRASKDGTVQCKVDSGGRIVAGGGAVRLDATGLKTYDTAGYVQCSIGSDGKIVAGGGHVKIDSSGINIFGKDSALTTRASETGTIQCKVDSSGRIVAGGGNVKLDSSGLTIKGETFSLLDDEGNLAGHLKGYGTQLVMLYASSILELLTGTDSIVLLPNKDVVVKKPLIITPEQYIKLPTSSTCPAPNEEGALYYDTSEHRIMYFDGTTWQKVGHT